MQDRVGHTGLMVVRFCLARRARWELAAVTLVIALITLVFAGGSYFQRDDLFFAQYLEVNPINADLFVRSWFGHLMPGYIASVVAFLGVFGLSWPAALIAAAMIHAGAFVAFSRCLDAVLGPVRMNVIAGLAFSLSLGPMAVRLWWAATLNNTFALALGLAVLGCATRWIITRRIAHLVAALLLYVVALSMSEKNLLFSLHIIAWCVLVVWCGRPLRHRLHDLIRTWPLWLGLGVLSLIDVVIFLGGGYVDESGASPSLAFSLDFIVHSIVGGLIPSLFGIDMVDQPTSLLDPRVVVTVLLFALFVAWTIVRVRSNREVWVFAAIAVLANAAVLSRRGEMITVAGGRQLRYLLESSALLWLAIGFALVAALRAGWRADRAGAPESPSARGGKAAIAGVLALVLALSGLSWAVTLSNILRAGDGPDARTWVESLHATLPDPTPPLIDSPLPSSFGMPALHPYNMVSLLLPSLGWDEVRVTTELDGAWVVGPSGIAGPAAIASAAVQFSGSRCSDGANNIPLPEVRTTGGGFLIVELSASNGDTLALLYDGGWTMLDRPNTSGRIAVYLPVALDGDLSISPQGGALCVDSVTVGDIQPSSPTAGSRSSDVSG
ncbi:hypothetical protein [Microbacterium sp.]|uniref:hypothetical protein n=1 Tax=Microbacterium sp. TaxID=51671 RepID=UPI003C75D71A